MADRISEQNPFDNASSANELESFDELEESKTINHDGLENQLIYRSRVSSHVSPDEKPKIRRLDFNNHEHIQLTESQDEIPDISLFEEDNHEVSKVSPESLHNFYMKIYQNFLCTLISSKIKLKNTGNTRSSFLLQKINYQAKLKVDSSSKCE